VRTEGGVQTYDPALIRINDRTISEDDIRRELQYHPAESLEAARQAAARALAIRELLLDRADALGIEPDAAATSRIEALIRQEAPTPQPTEAECRRFFANNRARFHTTVVHHVSHILRPAPPADVAARIAARSRCRRLLSVLLARPERFAALAERHSRCPSASAGGSLGAVGPGHTCPELERALGRMAPHSLAPHPVETRFGYHVVWLHAREGGEPLPFEAVRERIADYLQESVRRRSLAQFLRILAGRAQISGIDLDPADTPLVR